MTSTRLNVALAAAMLSMSVAGCRCEGGPTEVRKGQIQFVYENEAGDTLIQDDGVYDFGQVYMGQPKPLKMRVQNNGTGPMTLIALAKASGAAVDLSPDLVESNPVFKVVFTGKEVSVGETAEFDMVFMPPTASEAQVKHEVILTLSANNADRPTASVTLTGKAISGKCELPRELDFGAVARGDSFGRTVTFSNAGPLNSSAMVGQITSNSGDDKAFTFTADSIQGEVVIVPGQNKTATINFAPTEIKDYLALVKMRASDQCPDITVKLIGTGVDSVLTWTPSPLDFGYVTPGLTVSKDLTFQNLSMAPVTLSNLKTLSSEFKIEAPTTATVIVPAATRDDQRQLKAGTLAMTLSFKPTLLGPRSSQLTFSTTLTKQPSGAAQLKGYGGGPDIDVKPGPLLNAGRIAYMDGASLFTNRKLTVQNVGTRPNPPDVKANLHLGNSTGQLWQITALNADTALDEICVGEWDATAGSCLGTLLSTAYNPTIGLEAQGARSLVDIPLRLMPKSDKLKEWELIIYSDDPDEPAFKVTIRADAKKYPPCNYTVTPTAMNFGLVTPPDYKDLSFAIKNIGTGATELCLLSNVDIKSGSDPIFTLPAGPIFDKEMQPGEVVNVLVRAWPQGTLPATVTQATGAVSFQINNPTTPTRDVSLTAAIAQSCLTISPDDLDFGTVQKDCSSATRTFSIYNTCTGNVTVNSFSMVAPAGEPPGGPNCAGASPCPEFIPVSTAGVAPGTVFAPNAAPATFSIKYKPINYGADTGAFLIKVTQNGNLVDYIITLRGTGDTVGLNTDTFRQDSKPKADILLVIDDSCSMSDKQQALATNFTSFIKYAVSAQVDYQIGVTTTDQDSSARKGRIIGDAANPKILKTTTPNVQSLFQSKVNVGINGAATEESASVAVAALTAPLITSDNVGLIRTDASLAVVVVSDARDQSPQSVSFYANQLLNIKGAQRASQFSYNVIVPTLPSAPSGCSYDDSTAGNDPKHSQMAAALGGIKEEICNPDWAKALEQVGKNAFGYRTNFFLIANPDTTKAIVVKIDGVVLANVDSRGATVWTYDPVGNSVNFEPLYVPEPGKTLTITYYVQCIP